MLRLIPGLAAIADAHDLFLIDQWGVLHNGVVAFSPAEAALEQLRARGKRIVILSNSGKRAADSIARLDALGIDRCLYDHMVTSGEMVWRALQARAEPFYQALGQRFFAFTWQADSCAAVTDAGKEETTRIEAADFILCTGVDQGSLDHYQPLLEHARQRDLPMICANPDRVSLGPDGLLHMCAGAVAAAYETMGGRVRWHGKPSAETYAFCFALEPDCHHPLGIGDSLDHDIRGARDAGATSLLVCDGIHRPDLITSSSIEAALDRLCAAHGVVPDHAIARLTWS